MALDLLKEFDFVQYLENKLTDLSPNFVHKIKAGIVTHHFLLIYTRVMALDLRQNFGPTQIF